MTRRVRLAIPGAGSRLPRGTCTRGRTTLEHDIGQGERSSERFRGHLHGERWLRARRAARPKGESSNEIVSKARHAHARSRTRRRHRRRGGRCDVIVVHAPQTLTPDVDVQRRQVGLGGVRQTDPSLLGRTDSTPVNVMIKYDFDATASYKGGVAGLAATSPAVTGKTLKANAAPSRPTRSTPTQVSTRSPPPSRRPCPRARSAQTFTTVYGGVAAQVPANRSPTAQGPRRRGRAAGHARAAARRQHRVHRRDERLAVARRLGQRRRERHRRRASTPASGPSTRCSPPGTLGAAGRRPQGVPVRRRHRRRPSRPDVHLQQQAHRRVRLHRHVHGEHRRRRPEFCNNTTHQCSARDSEGHGTHTTTTAAGDCVDSAMLYGVQRGPVCGIAPGARVIEYRVCLAAAASAPTRSRRCSRRSATAST